MGVLSVVQSHSYDHDPGPWDGIRFAEKVLFENCAGCAEQSGWVGQGDPSLPGDNPSADNNALHKYLWTERDTCEATHEEEECRGFLEYDTCDLSAYPRLTNGNELNKGLQKCDSGDNKIGTNRMGFCRCTSKESPTFFCGHPSTLSCYDYCGAAR